MWSSAVVAQLSQGLSFSACCSSVDAFLFTTVVKSYYFSSYRLSAPRVNVVIVLLLHDS